jgi:hypothetical protein
MTASRASMSILLAQAALPPPDAIRRAADEVVARPYYDLGTTPPLDSPPLWVEIVRWIVKPFQWLFESMEGLPEFLRWLIVIVSIVICVALISHIIYSLVMAIRGPAARRRLHLESAAKEINPADLEHEAELVGTRGDYIGAIRLLFRAALRRIELAERKKFRPGFTNRELLRRYQSTPLFGSLAQFVETIELKWYGNSPCAEADYQACRGEHGRICQHFESAQPTVGA